MLGNALPPGLTNPLLAGAPTASVSIGQPPMGIPGGGNLLFDSAIIIGVLPFVLGGLNIAGGVLLKVLVGFGLLLLLDNMVRWAFPVVIAVGL